jgi:hypothetical protein
MANELPLPSGGGLSSGPPPEGSGNSSLIHQKRHFAEIHPNTLLQCAYRGAKFLGTSNYWSATRQALLTVNY